MNKTNHGGVFVFFFQILFDLEDHIVPGSLELIASLGTKVQLGQDVNEVEDGRDEREGGSRAAGAR